MESTSELDQFKSEIKAMMTVFFAKQEKELESITARQKEIQQTNANIESSIIFLSAQNDEYQKKIVALEEQLKENRKFTTLLEDKLEDLQRGTRKSNLEIKNVPKKVKETKEDLVQMVLSLSKSIGSNITKADIKDIYRVQGKKDKTLNHPIIVETSSTLLKTDTLRLCKGFNLNNNHKLCAKDLGLRFSEDTPIFVSEQLTAKGSRLHFLARDVAKVKSYKYCWTSYGKVYLKKDDDSQTILIQSEAQVQELHQL